MTNYTMTVEQPSFVMSLSRTGGQGSKGDSLTNIQLVDAEVIATITRADGTTYDINAGSLDNEFDIDNLSDFTISNVQDGDIVQYNSATSQFENHQFTTSKLTDVDNTNKEDGAVLVYDETAQKYQATNRIEKQTTYIIGGSF
jgi:hypothetical protein